MIIHGFAFGKLTKPDHDHYLQVLPASTSLILFHLPRLKEQRHLTAK
jgi:hypothetical protein